MAMADGEAWIRRALFAQGKLLGAVGRLQSSCGHVRGGAAARAWDPGPFGAGSPVPSFRRVLWGEQDQVFRKCLWTLQMMLPVAWDGLGPSVQGHRGRRCAHWQRPCSPTRGEAALHSVLQAPRGAAHTAVGLPLASSPKSRGRGRGRRRGLGPVALQAPSHTPSQAGCWAQPEVSGRWEVHLPRPLCPPASASASASARDALGWCVSTGPAVVVLLPWSLCPALWLGPGSGARKNWGSLSRAGGGWSWL